MTETVIASVLKPDEVILEDVVEIRPCRRCNVRLVLPVEEVGKSVSCPNCGCAGRALPKAGPFADVHIERTTGSQPTLDIKNQATERMMTPTIAPVVPLKKQDPIEERSAMVESVGLLQWIAALSLVLVAGNNLYLYLTAPDLPVVQERTMVTIVGFSLLNAALLALAGNGVRYRSWYGWGLAIVCSLVTIFAVSVILYQRGMSANGRFADFHLGILFSLPAYLCGIITVVVLLTPRYLMEFRAPK